jgi:hypothetical protein
MTGPAAGCSCAPGWPGLVVHTEDGDVAVKPAATPGGLACLYQAYCTGCGATYRLVPGAARRPAPPSRIASRDSERPNGYETMAC